MNIKDISTDELLVELNKRKKETSRPLPLGDPDFTVLIRTCEAVLDDISELGYSKDTSTYIEEAALTCVYGSVVHSWMNKYDEGC